MACQHGHTETAAALLTAGAKVNKLVSNEYSLSRKTPFYVACQHDHSETAAALLTAGAKVNQSCDGETPLSLACAEGRTETVAALLAGGAKVNQAAHDGATPLHVASLNNRLSIVQLLSSYGASRTAPMEGDFAGRTAEEVAVTEGNDELAAWLTYSQHWTMAWHHLATIGAERALALIHGGADLRAAGRGVGAPTPLSLAEQLRAEGSAPARSAAVAAALTADKAEARVRAAEGQEGFYSAAAEEAHAEAARAKTRAEAAAEAARAAEEAEAAADLVIRAAQPWSPQTHHLFPWAARTRAIELMLLGAQLERWTDVWMAFVVPYAVQRDYEMPIEQLLARCSLAAWGRDSLWAY